MKKKSKILNIVTIILAVAIAVSLVVSGLSLDGKNIQETVYGASEDIIPEQSEAVIEDKSEDENDDQMDEEDPEEEPEDEEEQEDIEEPEDTEEPEEQKENKTTVVAEEYTKVEPENTEEKTDGKDGENEKPGDEDKDKDKDKESSDDPVIKTNLGDIIGGDGIIGKSEDFVDDDSFEFTASIVKADNDKKSYSLSVSVTPNKNLLADEGENKYSLRGLTVGTTYTVTMSIIGSDKKTVKTVKYSFKYTENSPVEAMTDLESIIGDDGAISATDEELKDGTLDFSAWVSKDKNDESEYSLEVSYYASDDKSGKTAIEASKGDGDKQKYSVSAEKFQNGKEYTVEITPTLDGKTAGETLEITFKYTDGEDKELSISSNLPEIIGSDGVVYEEELTDNLLEFTAKIENNDGSALSCQYSKGSDSFKRLAVSSKDGETSSYELQLEGGSTYKIRLYISGKDTSYNKTYSFKYVAKNLDPITIKTNIEDSAKNASTPYFTQNRQFTVTVQAFNKAGNLTSDKMTVTLTQNGGSSVEVKNPTGGPNYEYEMYFTDPTVGDDVYYTLTIKANDKNGNEAEAVYYIQYHFVDSGDEIGQARVVIDATTAGLGILNDSYVTILQGKPASYTVTQALEDFGYTYEIGGAMDNGFYLRRITSGGMMYGAEPPSELMQLIEKDSSITVTGVTDSDSLGEFDFTSASGWMYSINDSGYAGKGLSAYYLSDGDTIYLRFTLALGKDIGGSYSGDGLPYYCGIWINGGVVFNHEWEEKTTPATCTASGETHQECRICGEVTGQTEIAPLGHDWLEVERVEPTESSDGYVKYRCQREGCGEEKTDILPMITPEPTEEPTVEPTPEPSEGQTE